MRKVKVFGYLRVSTKAQASTGQSLDTQKTLIADYVFRSGIAVVDDGIVWVRDAGISASKTRTGNRPGFVQHARHSRLSAWPGEYRRLHGRGPRTAGDG